MIRRGNKKNSHIPPPSLPFYTLMAFPGEGVDFLALPSPTRSPWRNLVSKFIK